MARPTRPSDRVRDLVLLARTPTSPGQPDVGLPRRSSMPSRALCARRRLGDTLGTRRHAAQTRRTPTRRRIVGGLRDDASVTSAPETERPESSEPSESPEASRRGVPVAMPARRPLRAARGADGAPGGAVCAGAAVRAGVGERADGQLAEGPVPPGVHAAQPHRVPAAGARRHASPARSPGRRRRRARRPAGVVLATVEPTWPLAATRAWSSPSGATVCRCGRWAGCSSTTRSPGRAPTRSPAGHGPAGVPGRHPGSARPDGAGSHAAGRPGRRGAHRVRATAPSWPAPPRRCCRASTCSPRPPPPSRRGRCG